LADRGDERAGQGRPEGQQHVAAVVVQVSAKLHGWLELVCGNSVHAASFRESYAAAAPVSVIVGIDGVIERGISASPHGNATHTVVPAPRVLSTQICPPCCLTMLRQIASPSPVPPFSRESLTSTCPKRSKMDSSLSAGMPRP